MPATGAAPRVHCRRACSGRARWLPAASSSPASPPASRRRRPPSGSRPSAAAGSTTARAPGHRLLSICYARSASTAAADVLFKWPAIRTSTLGLRMPAPARETEVINRLRPDSGQAVAAALLLTLGVLCRARQAFHASREDGFELGEQRRMQHAIRGAHLAAGDLAATAVEVGYASACFFYQQHAGGGVPRVEVELPESIHAARSDAGEVKRGGTGAAHAM